MPTDAHAPFRVRASDELRQAALEQFATVGFAASSLQQIADHAGYSKSSVLYHFASKEALLEAAIGPRSTCSRSLLERLRRRRPRERSAPGTRSSSASSTSSLGNRLAVHIFILQGQSLSERARHRRANAAVRRLAETVSRERESLDEQIRFGIALGGAAYLLTAGRLFTDDALPSDDELRGALHAVLGELLLPADSLPHTTID